MILGDRFRSALDLACELHGAQRRKGSDVPYLAHLLGAASIALDHGADEDEAIAALLHDAGEDQGGQATVDRIRETFGERVGAIVTGCSDALDGERPPWRERKLRYLDHLSRADASVQIVSASDKLHNARAILRDLRILGPSLWERFSGGRDGVLWYYGRLVELFEGGTAPRPLAEELRRVVDDLRGLVDARP